jgi:hypothetical protein
MVVASTTAMLTGLTTPTSVRAVNAALAAHAMATTANAVVVRVTVVLTTTTIHFDLYLMSSASPVPSDLDQMHTHPIGYGGTVVYMLQRTV